MKLVLLLCLVDLLVAFVVIRYVPFTEIDYQTYLQQVYQVFFEGKRDYSEIQGDTGPLVYPAGFLYVYRLFYSLSKGGVDLFPVQVCFAFIHAATLFTVCAICVYCKLDTREFLFCCTPLLFSRRVMSIHVLRLFNDAIVSFLSCLSVLFFVTSYYFVACLVYSFAVAVKMSALLYAPAVLIVLVETTCWKRTLLYIMLCGVVQVILALPFLLHHPMSYILKAFEFHRVFLYKWTVNWQFLPEYIFIHPLWSLILLLGHVTMLIVWYRYVIRPMFRNFRLVCKRGQPNVKLAQVVWGRAIATTLFQCQFIGIAFARSIHYQFYSWYLYSLPWILYSVGANLIQSGLLLIAIELVYNIYPPSAFASILLQCCHFYIIYKIFQVATTRRMTSCLTQSLQSDMKTTEE